MVPALTSSLALNTYKWPTVENLYVISTVADNAKLSMLSVPTGTIFSVISTRLCDLSALYGCAVGYKKSDLARVSIKLYGKKFWKFVSGFDQLYIDIIEPLGTDAQKRNAIYKREYNRMITRFTKDFAIEYCLENGDIDWKKIVEFNSGSDEN